MIKGLLKLIGIENTTIQTDEFPEMSRYERLAEETREYVLAAIK